MDEDLKQKIDETYELSLENNKLLHSIQRKARWSLVGRSIYWLVILGIGVGAFYYLKPYVENLMKVYESVKQTEGKIHDGIQNSFNFFKKDTQ